MTTELTTVEKKTLAKLGKEATREHRACLKLANDALSHACLAGDYLRQAKEAVPHGEWGAWLEEHFSEASETTGRGYMRISEHWSELVQNGNAVADLTVRGALKALAKPKAPDPLKSLPPEQQADCQKDYREECEATGEEPTAEGLREMAGVWAADNEPPDGDSEAPEPEPIETPTPKPEATLTACERFRGPHEKAILARVEKYPDERQPIACWLENLAAAIRTEI